MTFLKKHFGNIVFAGLLLMMAFKQIPLWQHSNKQIGKSFISIKSLSVEGEKLVLPTGLEKKVYIFWATWCGPCHVQLAQFDRSIRSGDLKKSQVVAVSLDKSLKTLNHFLNEKKYSFTSVMASPEQSWLDLNVQATPSIAFVEKKKVVNFFTGLSPLSVFKAKKFLD